jgi:hypothetical protein
MFGIKNAAKDFFGDFFSGKKKYITLYLTYFGIFVASLIVLYIINTILIPLGITSFVNGFVHLLFFYFFIRALMSENKNYINAVTEFSFDDFIKIGQIYAITLFPLTLARDVIFKDFESGNLYARIILDYVITIAVYLFLECLIIFASKRRYLLFGDILSGGFYYLKKSFVPLLILKILTSVVITAVILLFLLLSGLIRIFGLLLIVFSIPLIILSVFVYYSIAVRLKVFED